MHRRERAALIVVICVAMVAGALAGGHWIGNAIVRDLQVEEPGNYGYADYQFALGAAPTIGAIAGASAVAALVGIIGIVWRLRRWWTRART